MSHNIIIYAEGKGASKNQKKVFREFLCFQTSTSDSKKIMASSNPFQAYKDWCLERETDDKEHYYDEQYRYQQRLLRPMHEHCKRLDAFILKSEGEGLKVEIGMN